MTWGEPKPKIDHSRAISELEWAIRNNLLTAHRCTAYNDPQDEIDVYFERNKELQATVDFLKEQK